jgi:hypothetical protein
MWFRYHKHFEFCRVLLWPVKDATSYANIMQGVKSHIFVSDTLQTYTSLWCSFTEINSWFGDQLVQSCNTNSYINMVGNNMF